MSADNWAHCPRCTRIKLAEFDEQDAAIQAAYGVIPIVEFDKAREELAANKVAFENRQRTFREDYEFYGAEEGVVTVNYSGSCGECGLKLKFSESRPIPGLDEL